MSNHEFYKDKVEEALQLLSAHNELIDKQNLMIEGFMAEILRLQTEINLINFQMDKDKMADRAGH